MSPAVAAPRAAWESTWAVQATVPTGLPNCVAHRLTLRSECALTYAVISVAHAIDCRGLPFNVNNRENTYMNSSPRMRLVRQCTRKTLLHSRDTVRDQGFSEEVRLNLRGQTPRSGNTTQLGLWW